MASMPTFEPMDLVLSSKSIHGFNLSFFADETDFVFVFASMARSRVDARLAFGFFADETDPGRRTWRSAAPRVGGRGPTPRRARRDFWFDRATLALR